MSTARKILSNTAWQILGKLILTVGGLIVIKITTTYLSSSGALGPYGQYNLIYEYLAFFGIIADLGLYTIAVKEMSENPDDTPRIIGNVMTMRNILVVATMIIAVLGAFTISKFNFSGSLIPYGVLIAAVSTIFAIMNGTLTSVLQANYQMRASTVATILGRVLTIAVMFYVVFYGFPTDITTGFYWLVAAGTIGNLATLAYTSYRVRQITTISYRINWPFWKKVLKQALPYGFALILSTIYFRVDSLMIYSIRGEDELALYAPAMKTLEQIAIIPLYFMNTVLPVLTRSIKEKTAEYKAIIARSFDFLAALSVPMVAGGFALAYPIVFAITSPQFLSRLNEGFYGTDIALQILIFAVFFQFLNVLFAFILIAKEKQYKLLYINAAGVIFNITANYIFVPKYGFIAAAFTSVLSEILILIFSYHAAKKLLDFSLSLKTFAKILLAAVVMGLVVNLLETPSHQIFQNWNLLLLIPLGGLIYIAMLFLTKAIDKNMLKLLKKSSEPEIS